MSVDFTIKLARAVRKARALYRKLHAARPRTFGRDIPLPDDYRKLDAAYENLMDGYAADPELRPYLRCWMLVFQGHEEPAFVKRIQAKKDAAKAFGHPLSVRQLEDEIEPAELASAIVGQVDALSRRVRAWLQKVGANVTDSGAGCGGWHLGAHCTEKELRSLSKRAHRQFATEIARGDLTLSLHHWGWLFSDEAVRLARKTMAAKASVSPRVRTKKAAKPAARPNGSPGRTSVPVLH